MKLDHSKPYGLRYPTGEFEQDGKLFDRDGNEVVEEPVVAVVVPEPEAPAEDEPEVRRIDLRKKENAHLRPSAIAAKKREG